ncbi:MAG: hypothetical protein EXR98_12050 [Gemmataceae bacterium]|nr:hypothetical protein [Gemmataceae bacterium]
MDIPVLCTSCGQQMKVGEDLAGATFTCTKCFAVCRVPRAFVLVEEDNWDGKPYAEAAGAESICPQCGEALDTKVGICPACGRDLDAAPARPQPIKFEWGHALSVPLRLGAFMAYEVVLAGACVVLGVFDDESLLSLSVSGLALSALAAFVLGTVDQWTLKRTYEGRVSLTRTRRVCFIACQTRKISPRGYEAIATTESFESSAMDWLLALWLFSLFCIPGVVWLIVMSIKPTCQAALTKEHGLQALILYRGRDKHRMHDVARAVSEMFHFRVRI